MYAIVEWNVMEEIFKIQVHKISTSRIEMVVLYTVSSKSTGIYLLLC